MEQVVDERNMLQAWRNVKANKGVPGPDGITLAEFEENFAHQWPTVRQQLLDGTYQPSVARRKAIAKPDGSERFLGIPNVQERLLQQAILQVLTPIFDPGFSESSFGFRPRRSAQGAAKQVQTHIRSGFRHCLDMDLSKFFDRVQHDVLLARVARKVHDKRLLRLIGRYLRVGVMVDRQWEPSHEGTMQGGPLSPLLANILLDDFDKEFLGFRLEGYGGHIRVSPKNIVKFKNRVREITRRARGISMTARLKELGYYLRGWTGYFAIVPLKSFFAELDKWVRRRLRSCFWKQWRQPRTRIRNLLALGLPKDEAVPFGSCSRGAWFMAHCRSVQSTLSNEHLHQSGLVSLLTIWSQLAPKFRNA
jgi:RNA-directed DNA polymerase